MSFRPFSILLALALTVSAGSAFGEAASADWPMWRHDANRSGSTEHALTNSLSLVWMRELPAPRPAWPVTQEKLQFDVAPEPVVLGKRIFIPSNGNDSLTACDTETGRELWRFYAEAPIRFAPVAWKESVYVASDDSRLYCLSAADGKVRWSFRGAPVERRVIGNHRLVSAWPSRGGPVLKDGTLYFTASIWPFMGIFIYALDAETGKARWSNTGDGMNYRAQPHGGAVSFATIAPQGHLVISGETLIVPGGRSTPAGFDLRTGAMVHFNYDKRLGGHRVIAGQDAYYLGGRAFRSADGSSVADVTPEVTGSAMFLCLNTGEIEAHSAESRVTKGNKSAGLQRELLFKAKPGEDPGRIHLKAGSRIYCASGKELKAFDLPVRGGQAPSWKQPVEGDVWTMLAADEKLFVVTEDAKLYCFGTPKGAPVKHAIQKTALPSAKDAFSNDVDAILKQQGADQGFGVVLGLGSGRLAEELLQRTKLHLVVVDADEKKIDAFRRKMDDAGLYGYRVSALVGDPTAVALQPYMANLVVSETPRADAAFAEAAFRVLRPYGGTAVFRFAANDHATFQAAVTALKQTQASVQKTGDHSLLVREGALPGSADWTHHYADAAQSLISKDERVKLPLGVLWFGGPSHEGILPRHGHGPSPQVAGGRLFIEGPDMLRAVDVYTGRLLWESEIKGLGEYYNKTSHFPGAGEIGSNYVSLPDRIYAVYGDAILELEADTGKRVREIRPEVKAGAPVPNLGYIGVCEDYLVVASSPIEAAGDGKGDASNFIELLKRGRYAAGSRMLHVFDRKTGKMLWEREAQFNFRHNAIAIGAGKLFCLDKMTEPRLAKMPKGVLTGTPTLYALDLKSGRELWKATEGIFGTFLNYSAEHDVLLEGGSKYHDRASDEVGKGMVAYEGTSGKVVWRNSLEYGGPCMLWQDRVLTNGRGGMALALKTGKSLDWTYTRTYGCNTAIGGTHLLTFRSGAAGYADLLNDSGTGNLGGFKSGCTSNLIVADGVLSAPDYTRTCKCAYQNQTSLALVHMPENECWTYGAKFREGRIGLNFGAPGDRRDPSGTLWVDCPSTGGPSAEIGVALEPGSPKVFRMHALLVEPGELNWVASYGLEGLKKAVVSVPQDGTYQVRLCFLEPEEVPAGKRVFDVVLQGKCVAAGLDIVKAAGGSDRCLLQQFTAKSSGGKITLELVPKTERPALISGIELVRQGP